jgi:tRNA (guanine37-N1)-methyltransferase
MKIDILTLFPEMFSPLRQSIIGRAQDENLLSINAVDIRAFSADKHKKCDDYTFGGGAGMIMTPQPIADAFKSLGIDGGEKGTGGGARGAHGADNSVAHRIYMSPKGKPLNTDTVKRLSKLPHLIILCGHYEGVDQRIIDLYIDEEISVGDYILTGGELPAMVLVDAVARLVPEVLGSEHSAEDESFFENYLEYPQYTRPQIFEGLSVPEVLLSGNHKKIAEWRRARQIELTKKLRPDLIKKE